MRKFITWLAILMLLLNVIGLFVHPSCSTADTVAKTGIAGYDYADLPKETVWKMLHDEQDTTNPAFVLHATNAVTHALFHTEKRRLSIFENWLMWLAGKFYSPFGTTLNSNMIIKGGAGNCSERTQVLQDIYKHCGLDSRMIALNGHVSLEVFFKGKWMITDPDFGLVFNGDIPQLISPEGRYFADSVLTKNGFNKELINRYIGFWTSTDDNIELPVNQVTSPRLFIAEKAAYWLCWIIPVLMLGIVWKVRKSGSPGVGKSESQ